MSGTTSIEWTATHHPDGTVTPGATWNPLRGCRRVSEGCRNCYAERVAARFSGPGQPYEGLATMTPNGPRWTGTVRLIPELLDQPLRWKKPRMIFVNSMSDLFHEDVPFEFIDQVFAVMWQASHHTFQVLTKRPGRMREYFKWLDTRRLNIEAAWNEMVTGRADLGHIQPPTLPLPNVWLGVSVEDQKTADERIPWLLRTPAAVRWISAEPLLGPVDTSRYLDPLGDLDGFYRELIEQGMFNEHQVGSLKRPTLSWVVVGGESGPGARPMHPDWARSLVHQCQSAGVPIFVKQMGSVWARDNRDTLKGGDIEKFPADLRIRGYPD